MLLFLTRRMQNNKLIGQMLPRKLFGLIAHGLYPWHSQFFFSIQICDVVLYMYVHCMFADMLKELWMTSLLPSNRKLKTFGQVRYPMLLKKLVNTF